MTVEEIFSGIASHMIKGIMIHEHFANYYDFLGLEGYKVCHEYHFLEETLSYRKLCRYYLEHHNKLIQEERIDPPDIIPSKWYKHVRQDVDPTTKQNGIRSGLSKWVEWETDTKKLYEDMYKELMALGQIADALFVSELICDVSDELRTATRDYLYKEAISYNMSDIVNEQDHIRLKCEKKMKKLL